MNKYKNKKIEVDGIIFDSQLEALYYQHLIKLQEKGEIKSFRMQVPFILLDGYSIGERKERPIKIVIDFEIEYPGGHLEYHDPKGQVKPMDIVKKKMFESKYGYELIYIGKSIIDGGLVPHSVIQKGRKQRKNQKNK